MGCLRSCWKPLSFFFFCAIWFYSTSTTFFCFLFFCSTKNSKIVRIKETFQCVVASLGLSSRTSNLFLCPIRRRYYAGPHRGRLKKERDERLGLDILARASQTSRQGICGRQGKADYFLATFARIVTGWRAREPCHARDLTICCAARHDKMKCCPFLRSARLYLTDQ